MAHDGRPEYERYWQHARWFFGTPENAERFVRTYGTLDDFEAHHKKVLVLVEREERRQWLRELGWTFSKVFGAIGGALLMTGGLVALARGFFAWLGGP